MSESLCPMRETRRGGSVSGGRIFPGKRADANLHAPSSEDSESAPGPHPKPPLTWANDKGAAVDRGSEPMSGVLAASHPITGKSVRASSGAPASYRPASPATWGYSSPWEAFDRTLPPVSDANLIQTDVSAYVERVVIEVARC